MTCPIQGHFSFSYNRNGHGWCGDPASSMKTCVGDSSMLFQYHACPDIPGTESFRECLIDPVLCSISHLNPYRLQVCSWSLCGVLELQFHTPSRFPAVKQSISQKSEDLRLYNLVYNLTISNPGSKAVSSNASKAEHFFF